MKMKTSPASIAEAALEAKGEPPSGPTRLRLQEQVQMLGIPEDEMTPTVSFAVSALLEKVDDLNRELSRTKEHLSEIEQLVDVDCLVPVPNRRAFMRRLSWAISMCSRYDHPSSILYFDINDFKVINDTYGHAAGDIVIRHISQMLTGSLRESDFVARIGGDEFAIIMYHADEEAAKKRGRKLADTIHNTPVIINGKPVHINAACGYYAIHKGDDADSALASADMSMYVDKKRGKSRFAAAKA